MRSSFITAAATQAEVNRAETERDELYPFSIQPSGNDAKPWVVVDLSINGWGQRYTTYNEAKAAIQLVKQAAEAL